MTKARRPMTFQRALARIADLLGWDGCAEVLEKSESALRKMADPDIGRMISFQDGRRLDSAWRRAGGAGAPMLECYALQLGLSVRVEEADPASVIAAISNAAREHGEAISAAMDTLADPADPARRREAIREIEESIEAQQGLLDRMGGTVFVKD